MTKYKLVPVSDSKHVQPYQCADCVHGAYFVGDNKWLCSVGCPDNTNNVCEVNFKLNNLKTYTNPIVGEFIGEEQDIFGGDEQ